MSLLGTRELGRGVVVGRAQDAPAEWSGCPRVVVGEAELGEPGSVVQILQATWMERLPVVIELMAEPSSLRAPERSSSPVYSLSPRFEFTRERLQYLVWANNYDARSGELVWWHGRRAARLFADQGVCVAGPADIVLSDGTPLFVDGGPFLPPVSVGGIGVVHRWNVEAGSLERLGDQAPSSELAPDQLAAVRHGVGGARVIAPAGSGKTRVLTERLRHLVRDLRVHRGVVTALAFNTKAAEEMRERCAELLGRDGPHIRTLNSVGLWICNEFGRAGRLRTIDEVEVRELLQRLFEIRRQFNTDTVLPYIDALSSIRLGLAPPNVVEEAIPDAVGIAEGFERYRSALADAGLVDFDEQIYRAIEILVSDPDARATAQERCRLLLVDEFQDLNPAHMLLIRLLSSPAFNCFGVGDDDQVIYGYAGATPEFLIDFTTYFPGSAHHALEVNYRSPKAIISAATCLLSYNRERVQKTIRAPDGPVDLSTQQGGGLSGAEALRGAPRARGHAGRAGGGVGERVARSRHVLGTDSRPGPGQFGAAPRPAGLYRRRHSLHDATGHQGARPHRSAHRARVPSDRGVSRAHLGGGPRPDHTTTVPRYRQERRRNAHQAGMVVVERRPEIGRPALRSGRFEVALLCR